MNKLASFLKKADEITIFQVLDFITDYDRYYGPPEYLEWHNLLSRLEKEYPYENEGVLLELAMIYFLDIQYIKKENIISLSISNDKGLEFYCLNDGRFFNIELKELEE